MSESKEWPRCSARKFYERDRLEEKNGRAQNEKSKEYFSVVWRACRAVAGVPARQSFSVGGASLVGVLLKESSNISQKTPPSFTFSKIERGCLGASRLGNFLRFRKKCKLAEREGFEPSIPCGMPPFQGGALGRYATSPIILSYYNSPFWQIKNAWIYPIDLSKALFYYFFRVVPRIVQRSSDRKSTRLNSSHSSI